MSRSITDFEGILLVDKPSGITSHDVVDRVRRKLRMKRIGHAGTLDPLATGLLIILVGRATKLSARLMNLDKEYEGTFQLGLISDSHDCDGQILERRPLDPSMDHEDIAAAMATFRGDQYQTPPMFSAVKVGGVPLYKHARKGKVVPREPRFIRISKFDLLEWKAPLGNFYVYCSKGSYIRTLVHDMGEKLGCGGLLTQLRRTASHNLQVENAITLEDFQSLPHAEISKRLIPGHQAIALSNC